MQTDPNTRTAALSSDAEPSTPVEAHDDQVEAHRVLQCRSDGDTTAINPGDDDVEAHRVLQC